MSLIEALLVTALVVLVTPASGNPPLGQRVLEGWGLSSREAWQTQVATVVIALLLVLAKMTLVLLG